MSVNITSPRSRKRCSLVENCHQLVTAVSPAGTQVNSPGRSVAQPREQVRHANRNPSGVEVVCRRTHGCRCAHDRIRLGTSMATSMDAGRRITYALARASFAVRPETRGCATLRPGLLTCRPYGAQMPSEEFERYVTLMGLCPPFARQLAFGAGGGRSPPYNMIRPLRRLAIVASAVGGGPAACRRRAGSSSWVPGRAN